MCFCTMTPILHFLKRNNFLEDTKKNADAGLLWGTMKSYICGLLYSILLD